MLASLESPQSVTGLLSSPQDGPRQEITQLWMRMDHKAFVCPLSDKLSPAGLCPKLYPPDSCCQRNKRCQQPPGAWQSAWIEGDLCVWSSRGVNMLVELTQQCQWGCNVQKPPCSLQPNLQPTFCSPSAASKPSWTSSGWWGLPMMQHWLCSWLQPGETQWEAGLAGPGSQALLVLTDQGISHPSRSSMPDTPVGGFLRWGFFKDFAEVLVWKECAAPELPADNLAQKAPSVLDCAAHPIPSILLAFSAEKNSNSSSDPPEKWWFWGEDQREGAHGYHWHCGRTEHPHTSRIPAEWCWSHVRDSCSYSARKTHTCMIFAGTINSTRQNSFENTYSCFQPLPILETSPMINNTF